MKNVKWVVGFLVFLLAVGTLTWSKATYDYTVRIVDSSGNILGGIASGSVALYDHTVRVVDANNNVLNFIGPNNPLSVPTWLFNMGDGSETDPGVNEPNSNCTGVGAPYSWCTGSGTGTSPASSTLQGVHYYANFSVASGGTVTIGTSIAAAGSPGTTVSWPPFDLYVFSPGTCTVAGTINGPGTAPGSAGDFGGSGGGGGYGAANGNAGGAINLPYMETFSTSTAVGNGTAGTSGVAGGAGSTPDQSITKYFWSGMSSLATVCYSSNGGSGGSSGGSAGTGNGCIILDCATINFTGTIAVPGSNGGAGGSSKGPGGGGGGGVVITAAYTYTANTGTINVAGGSAGSAGSGTATAAGAGGNGWSKQFTLPLAAP